jgi:hypothetical protein
MGLLKLASSLPPLPLRANGLVAIASFHLGVFHDPTARGTHKFRQYKGLVGGCSNFGSQKPKTQIQWYSHLYHVELMERKKPKSL